MDDNEAALVDELLAMRKRENQGFIELIDQTQEGATLYKEYFEETLTQLEIYKQSVNRLTSAMDEQLKARLKRRRISLAVGLLAAILGIYLLWDSSTVGAGFHQTAAVAAGGALFTFFLVELILHSIVEIPTREAIEREKQVNQVKTLIEDMGLAVQKYTQLGLSASKRMNEIAEKTAPLMQQLREQ